MASPISTFFAMDYPSKPLAWMPSLKGPLLTKRYGFNPLFNRLVIIDG